MDPRQKLPLTDINPVGCELGAPGNKVVVRYRTETNQTEKIRSGNRVGTTIHCKEELIYGISQPYICTLMGWGRVGVGAGTVCTIFYSASR